MGSSSSPTRGPNAGVDNIARYKKTFTWNAPGDRAIAILAAGNLSITQGAVTRLKRDIQRAQSGEVECIMSAPTILRVAELVGEAMR